MLDGSLTRWRSLASLGLTIALAPVPALGQEEAAALPVLMSAEWAAGTCEAWNEDETLTTKLATWAENDADRGYKILRLYRTDCEEAPWVELRVAGGEDAVHCIYGGSSSDHELDLDVDYIMHARTERWIEMGRGAYGPMRAMMFGRLKFSGPMWEAMKNMGPFASFLQLVGAVDSDAESCPVAEPTVEEEAEAADAEETADAMGTEKADEPPPGR